MRLFTDAVAWASDAQWVYSAHAAVMGITESTSPVTNVKGVCRVVGGVGWTIGYYRWEQAVKLYGTGTADGIRDMTRFETTAAAAAATRDGQVRFSIPATGTPTAQVIFDGNSWFTGDGTGWMIPGVVDVSDDLNILSRTWEVKNYGGSGQTTINMLADAVSQVDSQYNATTYPEGQVVVAFEIINDLFFGATATDAYNRYVTYCTDRRSAGFKVVAITPTPRNESGTPGGYETSRSTVLTSIRANWPTFADALVDLAAESEFTNHTSSGIHSDLVHPSKIGAIKAGDMIAAAIKSVLAPSGYAYNQVFAY